VFAITKKHRLDFDSFVVSQQLKMSAKQKHNDEEAAGRFEMIGNWLQTA
jgi:hypothetical protein